ncbi:NmrA family NAD(P)-binding protein [Streptomyces ureilyticus]|uniref:NmrA family NAD(P)-binding protein n=1 Tax=Streptomyces ureilyticus TaxID=1775131 RepID=A0ABX0DNY6_9ACTN|nr:NmrA family NAD(P)-binding protein [Streptomyces ureilyticus]NGO42008.1 NmrA family NAD(P)-binding protein [Streptomyces ureilyticus]
MTYVIHGATGAQGAPVVAALAAADKPVVALTRNAEATVVGARVVAADYSSAEGLTEIYRDAEGVFVHLPIVAEEDRQAFARNVVTAVRAARPARVVFSTSGFVVDGPGSGDQDGTAGNAVAMLAGGLADSGVSYAVIEPRLFFENLLMPHVVDAVREQGVLRYPLPVGFRVSWASHLDIADVAAALFGQPDVTGVVSVGQYPAITGQELAEAFGTRLGRNVSYEAITPDAFRASLAPLLGEGPAADVAGGYQAMQALPDRSIAPERSAQKLLGITPRTAIQWLTDIGVA